MSPQEWIDEVFAPCGLLVSGLVLAYMIWIIS